MRISFCLALRMDKLNESSKLATMTRLRSIFRWKTKTYSKETAIADKAIIVQIDQNSALPSTVREPQEVSGSIVLGDEIRDARAHAEMDTDMSDITPEPILASENWIGDIRYEGEDEHEDASGRTRPPETDSDRPLLNLVNGFVFDTEFPTCADDNSMYYENSVHEAWGGSLAERQTSFTDLEMASGHVSDPGVYRTKSLCGSSSPLPSHGGCHTPDMEVQQKNDNQERIRLGDSSGSDSPKDPSRLNPISVTTHRSVESWSSGGELRSEVEFEDHANDGRFKLCVPVESARFKTGMSRVEEWVQSVHPVPPPLVEDGEIEQAPESPATTHTTPPFLGVSVEEKTQQAGGSGHSQVDADLEMAKMAVRSVNRLSTVAQISGVGLKVVPCLGMFASLKTLNLSANCIVRITPGCLPKNLHLLDVSRNQIAAIEGLRELTRLRVLNFSFNRISRIGNGLSSCTSLKEIHLAGNKISEVEGLHRLSKLVLLDLSFNKFNTSKSLGQIAANYKSLQALNVLGNAVQSNLGEEQIRRFVRAICPQMMYLNKQPLKSISTKEAVVDNLARAVLSKEPKSSAKNGSRAMKRANGHQSAPSHRRNNGGVQGEGQHAHRQAHRHSHGNKVEVSLSQGLPEGFVLIPPTATISHAELEDHGNVSRRHTGIHATPRVRSAGMLFRGDNHWSATAAFVERSPASPEEMVENSPACLL